MRTRREIARDSRSFPFFPRALSGCALRLSGDQHFDSGLSAFVVDDRVPTQPLEFEVQLEASLDGLARQAGVPSEALALSVVLEQEDLKDHVVLQSWTGADLPKKWSATVPGEQVGHRRVAVRVMAHLDREREAAADRAWRNGSLLAEREFVISFQGTASIFKVAWESFRQKGWDPEAIWHVEFHVLDGFHELSPEEAVSVYTNKDLPALTWLLSSSASRHAKMATPSKMTLRLVAAMAVADIAGPVLRDLRDRAETAEVDPEAVDPETLAGRVVDALGRLGIRPEGAMHLASEQPSELRERLQSLTKVGTVLDRQAMERMVKQ